MLRTPTVDREAKKQGELSCKAWEEATTQSKDMPSQELLLRRPGAPSQKGGRDE